MKNFMKSNSRSKSKLTKLFLSVVGLCTSLTGQTSTLIVDNDITRSGGHFQTIQEAINAADSGDTIMVMPSQLEYGRATIGKSITIMGPGFGGRSLIGPFQDMDATVSGFLIMGGTSEVTINGLVVSGNISFDPLIRIQNPDPDGTATITKPGTDIISDILITRNWFTNDRTCLGLNSSAWPGNFLRRLIVVNNDIKGNIAFGGDAYVTGWKSEIFLLNNRIRGRLQFSDVGIGNPRGNSSTVDNYAIIENNLITGGVELGKGRFRNNIVTTSTIYNRASTVSHNVFVGEDWPSRYDTFFWGTQLDPPYIPGQNLLVPELTDLMVWEGNWWHNWELVDNSPARGYASDGGDIGLFGGQHPWDREQMPNIPYISEFQAPVVVNQGQPIRVEVEVKLND